MQNSRSRLLASVALAVVVLAGPLAFSTVHPASAQPASTVWAGSSFCASLYDSPYLGNSYRGVAACGTAYGDGGNSNEQGPISYNGVYFDSGQGAGFQCVELVMRYMYYDFGVAPYSANGNSVVSNYSGSVFTKKMDPATDGLPSLGDILSFVGTSSNPFGHTGIVIEVSSSSLMTLNENDTANGLDTVPVSGGVVGGGVTGWLHAPTSNPPTNGWAVAFAGGASHNLDTCTFGKSGNGACSAWAQSGLTVSPGTSPSIAALPGGGWAVAFAGGASHNLDTCTFGKSGNGACSAWAQSGLTVSPGTSPSIAALPGGGWAVAFAGGGTNTLDTCTFGGSGNGACSAWAQSGLTVSPKSSPSIAALPGGGWAVAFAGGGTNTLDTCTFGGSGNGACSAWAQSGLTVSPGTSPSIAALPGGGWAVAFAGGGTNTLDTCTFGGAETGRVQPGRSRA